MSSEADIKKCIRAFAGIDSLSSSELCKVVSVDEDAMTCEVISTDQVPYTDVRLMADEEDSAKGFFLKPKVDSWVMITPQDDATYFVSMYSEVDEIWLHGTQYDGLVKVGDLVEKLNNLEDIVNDLILKFNTHTHILTLSAGTGTAAPTTTLETDTLTRTVKSDLENTKVLHG